MPSLVTSLAHDVPVCQLQTIWVPPPPERWTWYSAGPGPLGPTEFHEIAIAF